MASMPLAFESHPEWTPLSLSKSPVSSGFQFHSRMPPSREATTPHGTKPGQTPPRARGQLSPTPPSQESMRAFYPGGHSSSIAPEHMTEKQQYNMSTSPRTRHQSPPHHRNSRSGSQRSRRSADHSSLLAIGSWSSQNDRYGYRYGDHRTMSGNRSNFARDEDESSYKRRPYDDFILFPDESQTDTPEDVSAYTEQPPAPLAPRTHRLRTPDIAPLSTDVQFFPCLGDEAEEDRINEAWYLAGRERVQSQMDEALAYISAVGGRRRMLRD